MASNKAGKSNKAGGKAGASAGNSVGTKAGARAGTGAGTRAHPAPNRELPHDPYGHGHSVAAWTAVTLVMLGALLMSIAVAIGWDALWLFVVGTVIAVVVGPASGKLLGALGFGSKVHAVR